MASLELTAVAAAAAVAMLGLGQRRIAAAVVIVGSLAAVGDTTAFSNRHRTHSPPRLDPDGAEKGRRPARRLDGR